ncbi:MAG: NAD(P)/FAD-dependent oxidoreductase [Pseudomonadota bacterium]
MQKAEPHRSDVLIIGAGPVGLFAIFACGMLNLRTTLLDTLPAIGGQLSALYPEKPIYDIPGFATIDAIDLVRNLEAQARPFEPEMVLGEQAVQLEQDGDHWVVTTDRGTIIKVRSVILAAGGGAFGPNRPPLEEIEAYEGHSVHYMVSDRQAFAGQRLVIAGGGDSAVDWAISLGGVACHIDLVHRRDRFRAAPASIARLHELCDAGKVSLVTPYQLKRLEGADGKLHSVIVHDFDGNKRCLSADHLLAFFGLKASLGPLEAWGLATEDKLIMVDPARMETNRAGIYAIGDVASYPGKLKLILQGFADAAVAARAAWHRSHEGKALHFEYSTSRGTGFTKGGD